VSDELYPTLQWFAWEQVELVVGQRAALPHMSGREDIVPVSSGRQQEELEREESRAQEKTDSGR